MQSAVPGTEVETAPTPIPTAAPMTMIQTAQPTDLATKTPLGQPEPEMFQNDTEWQAIEDKSDTVQAVTTTTAGAAALGAVMGAGAAATPAMRLVIVAYLCKVGEGVNERDYPVSLHPTRMTLFDSKAVGMVFGNIGITLLFWVLMALVVKAVSASGLASKQSLDVLGICRFPSTPLFLFQFLLHGTALGAMLLVFRADNAGQAVLGTFALLFCMTVPIVLLLRLHKSADKKGYYMMDPLGQSKWVVFIIGKGEWVSRSEREHWVCRYASVLLSYAGGWTCFICVEMAGSLAIAAVQASVAESLSGCGYQKLFIAAIFVVLTIAEVYSWPRARERDCYLMIGVNIVQALAMILMAAGYFAEDTSHWGFDCALSLLAVAVILIIIKATLDISTELYVACKGRRSRLQDIAFGKKVIDLSILCDGEEVMHSSVGEEDLSPLGSAPQFRSYTPVALSGSGSDCMMQPPTPTPRCSSTNSTIAGMLSGQQTRPRFQSSISASVLSHHSDLPIAIQSRARATTVSNLLDPRPMRIEVAPFEEPEVECRDAQSSLKLSFAADVSPRSGCSGAEEGSEGSSGSESDGSEGGGAGCVIRQRAPASRGGLLSPFAVPSPGFPPILSPQAAPQQQRPLSARSLTANVPFVQPLGCGDL